MLTVYNVVSKYSTAVVIQLHEIIGYNHYLLPTFEGGIYLWVDFYPQSNTRKENIDIIISKGGNEGEQFLLIGLTG